MTHGSVSHKNIKWNELELLPIINVINTLNISVKNVDRKLNNICLTSFRKFRRPEPPEQMYEDAVPGKCICTMYL